VCRHTSSTQRPQNPQAHDSSQSTRYVTSTGSGSVSMHVRRHRKIPTSRYQSTRGDIGQPAEHPQPLWSVAKALLQAGLSCSSLSQGTPTAAYADKQRIPTHLLTARDPQRPNGPARACMHVSIQPAIAEAPCATPFFTTTTAHCFYRTLSF
jgi:hypothetical protein